MFCSCRADYQSAPPNSAVCPVCLGMPGSLPVVNRKAVEHTIATGLALNCRIAHLTKFDRKNYPYPDLMKGYQISQYDMPIASDGSLEIEIDGGKLPVGVTRVHLEEDVAKLQHVREPDGELYSLVDVNRSGVPLMEIVSCPDLRSPEQARRYLTTLRAILQCLDVTTGSMEEGSFRCDANVSIRPAGSQDLMTRAEVKNMNSFRSVFNALTYEVERQKALVSDGGRVVQETRGWVEERGVTVSQRTKEHAHDYRYFPEPDIPELVLNAPWVEEIRAALPELPARRRDRFAAQYGLPVADAGLLTARKATADFFEEALASKGAGDAPTDRRAKALSNWLLGDVARLLNVGRLTIEESKLKPRHLSELVDLIESGTLSSTLAKTVLQNSFETGRPPSRIAQDDGWALITDSNLVEESVRQAISQNAKAVDDYLRGKETAAKFLVGQVMRITKGKANPAVVIDLVERQLGALQKHNGRV